MKFLVITTCLILLLVGYAFAQSPQQQPPTPFDKDIQLLLETKAKLEAQYESTMMKLEKFNQQRKKYIEEQLQKKIGPPPPAENP